MPSSSEHKRALSAYSTRLLAACPPGSYTGRGHASRHRPASEPHAGARATSAYELDVELRDFLALDDQEFIGVVDEVRTDGTLLVACGWFGRRHVILQLEDIKEIRLAERELVLRSGLPEVDEIRAARGGFARLVASLVGRSSVGPRRKQPLRRPR